MVSFEEAQKVLRRCHRKVFSLNPFCKSYMWNTVPLKGEQPVILGIGYADQEMAWTAVFNERHVLLGRFDGSEARKLQQCVLEEAQARRSVRTWHSTPT